MSLHLQEPPAVEPFTPQPASEHLSTASPHHPRARWSGGCLAALATGVCGTIFGAVAALLALALLAPQPVAAQAVSAAGADLSINVTDAYLTRTVVGALAHASLPTRLTAVQIHIEGQGLVAVSAAMPDVPTLPGQPARRVLCVLSVGFANGALSAQVDSFSVGALPLPAPLTQALQATFANQLPRAAQSLLAHSSFALAGVNSAPGMLTLLLRTR